MTKQELLEELHENLKGLNINFEAHINIQMLINHYKKKASQEQQTNKDE